MHQNWSKQTYLQRMKLHHLSYYSCVHTRHYLQSICSNKDNWFCGDATASLAHAPHHIAVPSSGAEMMPHETSNVPPPSPVVALSLSFTLHPSLSLCIVPYHSLPRSIALSAYICPSLSLPPSLSPSAPISHFLLSLYRFLSLFITLSLSLSASLYHFWPLSVTH